MSASSLLSRLDPPRRLDRLLLVALVLSALLHGGILYGLNRWGPCVCNFGKVVCPKMGQNCDLPVAVKVVESEKPKPPPPPPPKPKPKPTVVVEKPRPNKPPAAPKAGKVVLPDEALKPAPPPKSEITVDRPALPEEVVVKQSEADAPVIATGEIFERAGELTAGEPGQFGLGGTGTGVGTGPFGTDSDGSGTAEAPPTAPVVTPKPPPPPPPKPKGPSRPPKVLNWTDPPYPDQARQQGIEGTVVLRLTVMENGRPTNVTVARSSGHAALDQAALGHVKRARFKPALRDGRPVAMTITFRVKFRLVNR